MCIYTYVYECLYQIKSNKKKVTSYYAITLLLLAVMPLLSMNCMENVVINCLCLSYFLIYVTIKSSIIKHFETSVVRLSCD